MGAPRTHLVLLLVLSLAPAAGSCAFTAILEASRAWKENGEDHFQLLLRVPDPWRQFAHMVLEWPEHEVEIVSAIGASLVRKEENDGTTAEFELDGVRPSAHFIQVVGTRTLNVKPGVLCREAGPPAPVPPHAEYCMMGPTYKVVRMWAEALILQVSLEFWADGKIFSMTFLGERVHVNIESVVNAEFVDEDFVAGNTMIRIRLVPKDYLHGGKLSFSFQISPPAHKQPIIECHAPWRPPPPPPPPFPSPKPRPPPQPKSPLLPLPLPPVSPSPVREIYAGQDCRVGARMKVEMMRRSGMDDVARVVVRLARWEANTEILAVMRHQWNSRFSVTDLARTALISQELEPTADATQIVFKPSPPIGDSTPFFGFNVQGRSVRLDRLSCRLAAAPPPSPPPFVFKPHKAKHTGSSAGVHTSAKKSASEHDQPLGAVAFFILAGAFLFMFKDLVARLPSFIASHLKTRIRLPGYGTVITEDTDVIPESQPNDAESALAAAPSAYPVRASTQSQNETKASTAKSKCSTQQQTPKRVRKSQTASQREPR